LAGSEVIKRFAFVKDGCSLEVAALTETDLALKRKLSRINNREICLFADIQQDAFAFFSDVSAARAMATLTVNALRDSDIFVVCGWDGGWEGVMAGKALVFNGS